MKKFFLFAALVAASVVAFAGNRIAMSDNDTVRINPNRLDGYFKHNVTAHFEGMCDTWQMEVTYPDGFFPKLVAGVAPLSGLTVTYIDRYGNEAEFTPNLNVSAMYKNVSAYISVNGYWDYNFDNEYESYGSAKWMPGDYEMFEYNFYVSPEFRKGYVVFDGMISSGRDDRGAILQNVRFFTRTYFWVGYEKGDVSGDGQLSITDVTLLISFLMNDPGDGSSDMLNEFQKAAADVNDSGSLSITDVTGIIAMLMNG